MKNEDKEITSLFTQLWKSETPETLPDKIEREAVIEFEGGNAKTQSRQAERTELLTKLARLKKKFNKTRNSRVASHRTTLNKKLASKRASLKQEINAVENALEDLKLENSQPS